MKLNVYSLAAADADDAGSAAAERLELKEDIFGLTPRKDILHRMVVYQLAKRRAGTHHTKTRSEVRRTTAKFGRQKGGGRARHGSRRAGIFVGGAKAFGPKMRDHAIGLPKKLRVLALRHALSAKAGAGELMLLDKAEIQQAKTAPLKKALDKLGLDNALIIGGSRIDANFVLAARNIVGIDVLPVQGINVRDILRRRRLALTREALEALEARLA